MLKGKRFSLLNRIESKFGRYFLEGFGEVCVGVRSRILFKRLCLALTFVLSLLGSIQAAAFGIGSAQVNSYIGEPLNVSIPIFNIADPDALSVELVSSSMVDRVGEIGQINIHLSRDNSQLAIVVGTDWLVNEPYLNFELQVSDLNNTASKKFTVLLNLRDGGSQSASLQNFSSRAQSSNVPIISRNSPRAQDSNILGPYDWAEKGSIPARFGAVIDGQSLWRVARRINQAMDVSIDQMMLALYLKNPSAFATASVDSLKVGSYLDIPNREFVVRYTERQAINELKNLVGAPSGDSVISKRKEPKESELGLDNRQESFGADSPNFALQEDSDYFAEQSMNVAEGSLAMADGSQTIADGSSTIADGSYRVADGSQADAEDRYGSNASSEDAQSVPFRTSNLDQSGRIDGAVSTPAESQEIISSLATTVGNLTQELIRKDKRIEYLEQRIEAIQEFSGVDADQVLRDEGVGIDVDTSSGSKSSDNINYYWFLPLIVLALFSLLFRDRLAVLWNELNMFGKNDRVHFEETVVEVESDADMTISKADFSADKEISILAAVQQKMKKEHIDEVSFLDLEDVPDADQAEEDNQEEDLNTDAEFDIRDSAIVIDELGNANVWSSQEDEDLDANGEPMLNDESDHLIEFETSSPAEQDRILSFDERIDKLLEEEDFAFAEELLEFSKNNEIEEDRYHYERLRLLLEKEDRDGFYDYYYTIESEIPEFDEELSNGIAVMISVIGR